MGKVGYVIVLGTHYSCMLSVVWCVSGKGGGVCHSAGYTL